MVVDIIVRRAPHNPMESSQGLLSVGSLPTFRRTILCAVYDSEVSAVIEAALNKPPMSQSVIVLEDASGMQSSNDSGRVGSSGRSHDCCAGGGKARSKTLIIEGERQPVTVS